MRGSRNARCHVGKGGFRRCQPFSIRCILALPVLRRLRQLDAKGVELLLKMRLRLCVDGSGSLG